MDGKTLKKTRAGLVNFPSKMQDIMRIAATEARVPPIFHGSRSSINPWHIHC